MSAIIEQAIAEYENAILQSKPVQIQKLFQSVASSMNSLSKEEKNIFGTRILQGMTKFSTPCGFLEGPLCNIVGIFAESGANANVFGPLYIQILKRSLTSTLEIINIGEDSEIPSEEAISNIQMFCPPSQAILGSSEDNRKLVRSDPILLDVINSLRWKGSDPKMLHMLLNVVDGEELFVIHSESSRIFKIKIWGISDNAQLHILLADRLIQRGISGNRPPATIVSCMEGDGGQKLNQSWIGEWNLYNWTALDKDGKLPDPKDFGSQASWVWGEGVPVDIAPFNGVRTLFLGPPSYNRIIQATRVFGPLRARLEVMEELSPEDSKNFIQKIAACDDNIRSKAIEFVKKANSP